MKGRCQIKSCGRFTQNLKQAGGSMLCESCHEAFKQRSFVLAEGFAERSKEMERGDILVRAESAACWGEVQVLTGQFDEHPEDWDGPCFCKLCMSYAEGG